MNARIVAEVGVWKGDFAASILAQCDCIERYYMIDPWANLPNWNKPFNVTHDEFSEIYDEAMEKTHFAAKKVVVLRNETKHAVENIPDNSLDFAYIDGDHTLRGITIDLIKLLPKIREGGLIGGDDFTNNPWQHDARFEPTLVCPFSIYFAEAANLPIVALPLNQFLMQKTSDSTFSFTALVDGYEDISLKRSRTKLGAMKLARKFKLAVSRLNIGLRTKSGDFQD